MRSACLLVAAFAFACIFATPLDDYLARPDPYYSWKIDGQARNTVGKVSYTAYFMNLTSQSWLTPSDTTNGFIWRHWVTILVPDTCVLDKAFMYIDGGHTRDPMPTDGDEITKNILSISSSVSIHLEQIPNEPITFTAEGRSRSEDGIIAYTWKHFIDHPNETDWLLRMPMVKASVKALDAVEEFLATLPHVPKITGFGVGGASKRGWTTWLVGAVDKRVIGIVPIVLDVLQMVPNLNHHWRAYGNWSFALEDYYEMGLMQYLNDPIFEQLAAIIDPYSYRDRLALPKYMICACGDEFFLPDDPQFFWADLPGPKVMRMVPNAEHSMAGHALDVSLSAATWFMRIAQGQAIPEYSWVIETADNHTWTITLTSNTQPKTAKMWHAHNPLARDFRLITNDDPIVVNPIFWWEEKLDNVSTQPGTYVYKAVNTVPETGWRGFMVELVFDYGHAAVGEQFVTVTSEVQIIPDVLPYPPCGQHCQ